MKEIRNLRLTDDQSNALYIWLDSIPLSRQKKNIARDFSDCVLVAEIVAHMCPKVIDIHNYPQAHNNKQKFTNWNTMNRKILKRLGLYLTEDNIIDLVELRPMAIEHFLHVLKPKLEGFEYTPVVISKNKSTLPVRPKKANYQTLNKIQKTTKKVHGFVEKENGPVSYYRSKNDNKTSNTGDVKAMLAEKDDVILSLNETIDVS